MMTQSNLTFTENHEIPEGYKKTEVGFIPENWNVVSLMHISEKIMVGIASSATHAYRNKGIPLLRNQNIKSNKLDDEDIIYISEDYEKGFFNKRLKEGDLLTARTGYPGTTCLVPKIFENAQSFTTLITRLKSDSENPIYLSYFINSEKGQKFFTDNQIGGGQKNVNAATLKRFPVIVPPLNEQQKIATALSDTDALISELEKLIEKKQAIKNATMQQLLTGKTRLPEFALREDGTPKAYKDSELGQIPEDWEALSFSEVCTFINGRAYGLHEWEKRGTPVIRLQNLTGRGEDYYYSTLNLPAKHYCDYGDLLFMWSATFGPVIWKGQKAIYHYHIWKIVCNENVDKDFLYLTLDDMTENLKRGSSSGGTMLHVTKEIMEATLAIFPPYSEQLKIASVLNGMIQEIEALTEKLTKLKNIKQGMMQELLTGKTRLV